MRNEQFLRETWAANKCPENIDFSNEQAQWTRLEIVSVKKVGQTTNQGKNAPCACGSGKKFKRCCGAI